MDLLARIRPQKQLLRTATANQVYGSNRESSEDTAILNTE